MQNREAANYNYMWHCHCPNYNSKLKLQMMRETESRQQLLKNAASSSKLCNEI